MEFKEKIQDLLKLLENWLTDPEDYSQLEQWIESADTLVHSFEFSDIEQVYIDRIIDIYEEQIRAKIDRKFKKDIVDLPSKEYLDELLNAKQVEQRTPEWYAQMNTIISASELGNLFASPRQRALLVMSKVTPYQPRFQPLATLADCTSAFDWGIRFEPVVKQIYEFKYGTIVKELGRLTHKIDSRCTASPDGLVYTCPENKRTGRLIEIKCPVTREINGSIPKNYYAQMQMQLHVTGLKQCDYIEAVFSSKYNNAQQKEGPGVYNGFIGLIRYPEVKDNQEFYYAYSPINADNEWIPDIKEGEEIVEIIPWRLLHWSEHTVLRSEEWWTSMQPMIDAFWEDVEKARRGEFVVPESSRPPKKPKDEKCIIVFTKLDENNQELISI
jgi:hypothetical protein